MVAEARVGILALVVVMLVVGTLTFLSGHWGWVTAQHLLVHFRNVEGLTEGSEVLFSGMEIGRVLEIRLATPEEQKEFKDCPIVAHLVIKKDMLLKDTDEFIITQSGMLGNTHVAVRRKTKAERDAVAALQGEKARTPKPLASGDHLAGTKAVGITELGDDARALLAQIKASIEDFSTVYAGPEIREQLPAILANVERATAHAVEFSEVLASVAITNERRIGQIAGDIALAANELSVSAERVRQMVLTSAPHIEGATGRVAQMIDASAGNVEATSAFMASSAEDIKHSTARVAELVDNSAGNVEATVGSLKQTGDLVVASAENIRATTTEARATLSRVAQNLDEMVAQSSENITKTTATIEETTRVSAERLRKLVEQSAGNLEVAAANVEKSTRDMAALVESSGADIGKTTRRISDLVEKSAGDVETASANLAQMSEKMHGDFLAMSSRARTMIETSAGNVEAASADLAGMSEKMHGDMAAITGRARTMVESSSANVEKTVARVALLTERSADDIERTTRRIHDVLALSPVPNDLAAASGSIRRAAKHVETITGEFEGTFADPETQASIRKTIANLTSASDHIAAVTQESELLVKDGRRLITDEAMWQDIKQMVASIKASADDLKAMTQHGREVFTSPEFTEDVTQSAANVRKLTERGADLAAKADDTMERINLTVERVQDVSRKLQPEHYEGYISLEGIDDFGLRSDLVTDLYFGDRADLYWRLGIRDLGDHETGILQRGVKLQNGSTFRLGLFGNKIGAGYDRSFGDGLGMELDLWDPDDLHLDARWLWDLGSRWGLTVGAENVFGGTEPFIGFRRRAIVHERNRPARKPESAGLTRSTRTEPTGKAATP